MRWIMLTFKNIGKFIRFHPVMFLFLIFAQVVCCIAVYISCGMAYNMEYVEKPGVEFKYFCYVFETHQIPGLSLAIERDDEGNLTGGQYLVNHGMDYIYSLEYPDAIPFSEFKPMMEEAFAAANNSQLLTTHITIYRGNKIDVSEDFTIYLNTSYPGTKENFLDLSDEQINTDKKVFYAPASKSNGKHSDHCYYYVGRKYDFNGIEFECVGETGFAFIPYNAVPDDFAVGSIFFYYDGTLTENQITEIKGKLDAIFGDRTLEMCTPEAYDPIEIQYSKMLFIVSIVVILIILLALSKFYKFILSDRKNTLSVLRLCGCTRTKAHIVYMLEIFLTMAVTTGIGYLLYKFVFHSPIAEMYPAFEAFYITPVYLAVTGGYFAAAMIIMSVTAATAIKTKTIKK